MRNSDAQFVLEDLGVFSLALDCLLALTVHASDVVLGQWWDLEPRLLHELHGGRVDLEAQAIRGWSIVVDMSNVSVTL